ncbi:hypothetical protein [Desulfosporosinus nitroreducens]|uniref:hypothetical protein n=1 Tax=Desulfosporosinus nitroreducens TaxID=2018668 RepID=UPI00207C6508|nr:hypothetical protein [Desulfosporosinus nitroreducens]MCO1600026.1 hypothetical protein [Desulfosporosinus nitroreducens]
MMNNTTYIDSLIREFENNCPTSFTSDQYVPKVKVLFSYLTQTYDGVDNSDPKAMESLFKYTITHNDLIESTVFYIKDKRLTFEQAIYDSLISFNAFFKFLNYSKNIENTNLIRVFNNSEELKQIYAKIKILLNENKIFLKPRQQYPSLQEEEFKFINNYLISNPKLTQYKSVKSTQCLIILKLFLLLGLKPEKLFELPADSVNLEYNYIKIPSESNNNNLYISRLPNNIIFLFKKLYKLREKAHHNSKGNYLFFNRNGKMIDNDYTTDILKDIEDLFYNENLIDINLRILDRSQFTQSGLTKYAIINMIKANIPQSLILDFTGNKSDIYDDCQNSVNTDNFNENSRYIDSKIRGIETYDYFNELY